MATLIGTEVEIIRYESEPWLVGRTGRIVAGPWSPLGPGHDVVWTVEIPSFPEPLLRIMRSWQFWLLWFGAYRR